MVIVTAFSTTTTPSSGIRTGPRGSSGTSSCAMVRRSWTTVTAADRRKTGSSSVASSAVGVMPGGTGKVTVVVPA